MGIATSLEKAVLDLPPAERERLALVAWESLEADLPADPDGSAIALERDAQIESGTTKPISHAEFLRATGGTAE